MSKSALLVTNHQRFGQFGRALGQIGKVLRIWHHRYVMRCELGRLSEHDLHDIGRSWSDVVDEVDKPFWRE
ncbi:DUF1127 domain-containing protein [Bradyrhizobium jicamae]|uniref:DUF1127 domain-containing protein n=1 Tax=Bradyrhizobium jicamae TaxID=280332 RepID=A0ABS5FM91_9BRAD|nr:DUF1127 domain-containing protein [Bradyrhizobium jicamae]MBR0931909.1 DUF1127 domain-containing protein [Bradyrhizobium jicamae]